MPAFDLSSREVSMPSSLRRPFLDDRYDDGVFHVSRAHGFLPQRDPLATLPSPFEPVQAILDAMPVWLADEGGPQGLLATPGAIAEAVEALPDLHDAAASLDPDDADDVQVIAALFRAYTFLSSAYTLEPAHHARTEGEGYGTARNVLPPQLARPLVVVADALGVHPWLDYHYAYSLYNYVCKDPSLPAPERFHWSNLGMAVKFSGLPDEAGFIMLHVHIDAHSGRLVGSAADALEAADDHANGVEDALPRLRAALAENLAAMVDINEIRKLMWQASRHRRYNDFRVFIMGITGNEALFGPGVTYEGVERMGGRPQQYRGQSGAQDDVIPTEDVLTGLIDFYPDNELTRYLIDLRQYRPVVVRNFLADLEQAARDTRLWPVMRDDPEAASLLLGIVEQIYLFRNGHWQFVQKYILAHTRYATATGGTPITTWIPNQIEAALAYLQQLIDELAPRRDALSHEARARLDRIAAEQGKRIRILEAQIEELSHTNYDASLVYALNADQAEGPAVRA